jgi:hypothetical protein
MSAEAPTITSNAAMLSAEKPLGISVPTCIAAG